MTRYQRIQEIIKLWFEDHRVVAWSTVNAVSLFLFTCLLGLIFGASQSRMALAQMVEARERPSQPAEGWGTAHAAPAPSREEERQAPARVRPIGPTKAVGRPPARTSRRAYAGRGVERGSLPSVIRRRPVETRAPEPEIETPADDGILEPPGAAATISTQPLDPLESPAEDPQARGQAPRD